MIAPDQMPRKRPDNPFEFSDDSAIDEVFYKVLTQNDDASKHGVLIPTEAWDLVVPDRRFPAAPKQNDRFQIPLSWAAGAEPLQASYLYYQRYPERRLGALGNDLLNERKRIRLLVVGRRRGLPPTFEARLFMDALPGFGAACDYLGIPIARPGLAGLLGSGWAISARRPAELVELLHRFDEISQRGFVPAVSLADASVGETLESLLGIRRNNSPFADYNGIELKCAITHGNAKAAPEEDLFLKEPTWTTGWNAGRLLSSLGYRDKAGRQALYTSVSVRPNGRGFRLRLDVERELVTLEHKHTELAAWHFKDLAEPLRRKSHQTAFVLAEQRRTSTSRSFHYVGFTWCQEVSVQKLLHLIDEGSVWVEFRLRVGDAGKGIRNRGTQFRIEGRSLERLYSHAEKLR